MKLRLLILAAGMTAAAAANTVQAQVVISMGNGLGRDCFLHAKAGNQLQEGVEICNRALAQEMLSKKDRAGTYDNRGVMQDMLDHTSEAASDFNTAIVLDPTLGDPHVNLGSMLIKQHRYQDGLDQINTGLELGMAYPHIGYYDRAIAEQMLGRFKDAYFDYKKVLELEPNFVRASERLKDFVVTRAPAKTPS